MTSKEAKQQVEACERKIKAEYKNLQDAAMSIGDRATQAQSSKTSSKTKRPLILSLIGLLLCFASHPVWGVLFIIGGGFFAYTAHSAAALIQMDIETKAKNLNKTLEYNSKI